jgi:hypothetical protein
LRVCVVFFVVVVSIRCEAWTDTALSYPFDEKSAILAITKSAIE